MNQNYSNYKLVKQKRTIPVPIHQLNETLELSKRFKGVFSFCCANLVYPKSNYETFAIISMLIQMKDVLRRLPIRSSICSNVTF